MPASDAALSVPRDVAVAFELSHASKPDAPVSKPEEHPLAGTLAAAKILNPDSSKNKSAEPGLITGYVINPFINGTGLRQVAGNFTEKPLEQLATATNPGAIGWGIQTLSSTAGAIVPYVVAAKVTGGVMRTTGRALELTGAPARVFASENLAQIVGAGVYDGIKRPNEQHGETRTGAAVGGVSGFAFYTYGNSFASNLTSMISNPVLRLGADAAGKMAVGAMGGLTSYEASNRTSNLLGQNNKLTNDGRVEAMVSGAFINTALPAAHSGLNKFSQHIGLSQPVERYVQARGITDGDVKAFARENPLALVKESSDHKISQAYTDSNLVVVSKSSGAAGLAHELAHLRVSRESEPHYARIAELTRTDSAAAETQFLQLRASMEQQARIVENSVRARMDSSLAMRNVDPAVFKNEPASGTTTYAETWAAEFKKFQQNPNFRPGVEHYGQAHTEPLPAENRPASVPNPSELPQVVPATSPIETPNRPLEYKPEPDRIEPPIGRKIDFDKNAWGSPEPLGATVTDTGVNFAVHSQGATKVELLLFDKAGDSAPSAVLSLNKSGNVWHRFVEGLPEHSLYLYRADGPYTPQVDGSRFNPAKGLIDPHAKSVTGDTVEATALGYDSSNPKDPDRHLRPSTVDNIAEMPKAVVVKDDFDWQGTKHPNTPLEDAIYYEAQVYGFTAGDPSAGPHAGKYLGVVSKIDHLLSIGVTDLELLPTSKFDADHWPHQDPLTGVKLKDVWAYNPVVYKAPETRFATSNELGAPVVEYKTMARELRKSNIGLVQDVVFNHTREGNELGPTVSFRGLDNNVYYMLDPKRPDKYIDHTGCGNTFNCNNPVVQNYVTDVLSYWHQKMGVGGFRFDLASTMKYMPDDSQQAKTPVIDAIETHPELTTAKLIAEPWSMHNYYLGKFSNQRWAEWNGSYRDLTRQFFKGNNVDMHLLADRIAGSPSMFDSSQGRHSMNFITIHDGFTMNDLVSYDRKWNDRNGENGKDGSDDNHSWNHGFEGPVSFDLKGELTKIMTNLESMDGIKRATVYVTKGAELEPAMSFVRNEAPQNPGAPSSQVSSPIGLEIAANADGKPSFNKPSVFQIPMRMGFNRPGMGLLEIELSGKPLKPGDREIMQSVAWQGANAIEIMKRVESLPPERRAEIEQLRNRQMKNMRAMLMLSRGTPMLSAGDEFGRTAYGNNNFWCNEDLNIINWNLKTENADQLRHTQEIVKLRKEFKIGHAKPEDFTWHGVKPMQPDWTEGSHFIAFELPPLKEGGKRLYAGFNSYWEPLDIKLPAGNWRRRSDTFLQNGQDINGPGEGPRVTDQDTYKVQPRSMVIFESE